VEEGEVFGIIGPNGAGKTTMFNMVSGIERCDEGALWFSGADITNLPPFRRCHLGIGRTFQLMQPFQGMTVLENVMVGILYGTGRHVSVGEARLTAEEILEFTGLADRAGHPVGDLTTADLKRLEISRALGSSPKLLLLDEVVGGLTPSEVADAIKLIRDIVDRGVTVLMIEHVMGAVRDLCDRVLVMHHGEELAVGIYTEVASNPEVIEAYLGEEDTDE
jgi:branched-chain amino acid transport system ATP-binding protein